MNLTILLFCMLLWAIIFYYVPFFVIGVTMIGLVTYAHIRINSDGDNK